MMRCATFAKRWMDWLKAAKRYCLLEDGDRFGGLLRPDGGRIRVEVVRKGLA